MIFHYFRFIVQEAKNIAVFITSTGWGGLEMNTLKLVRLLKNKGYNITLFSQLDAILVKNHSPEFHQIEYVTKRRKYFDFKTAKEISKKLKSRQIHLVFVVDNKDLDVLAWTKRLFYKDLKIVYQQHMQIGINKKDFFHTFRFKAIDTWISPLNFLKNEIGLRTRFPINKVQVIPIGLDTKQFLIPKYTKHEAREKLSISTELPLLGIIGRISEKKGQLFVTQMILALREKGVHLELLIFGSATINDEKDKNYAKELHDFVNDESLNNVVHFVDYKEDVNQFYNAIDVFVLASHSETYGMVTIEAMLSSVPVIATHSGGTPEILDHGKLGKLYSYENASEFCEVLLAVLNNMDRIAQTTKMAQEVAKNLYHYQSEVDAIDRIFTQYLI